MDINEILAQAKRNKHGISKVNRYSTDVKPAKKLQRTVDPAAIKAFLKRKEKDEKKNNAEAKKKKEELKLLRDNSKTTKKANSMAKRTKDNLKLYKGEDVLGLYPEPRKRRRGGPPSPPLSPEADRRHKAFMKNIIPKVKVPGVNDDESDDSDYKEPVLEEDGRKIRKLEKKRAKARTASNLEFSDLLQLAEKHKNKVEESSSGGESESADSDSENDRFGKPLTAEEKYQRERRKRRELEERLKAASTQKRTASSTGRNDHHRPSTSSSLGNFKIAKLNSGMSEENKRAKVKALMEKLKNSSKERSTKDKSEKKGFKDTSKQSMKKSHSAPSLQDLKSKKKSDDFVSKSKHKHNGVGGESSRADSRHSAQSRTKNSTSDLKVKSKLHTSAIVSRQEKLKPCRPSDSELRQTKITPHLKKKVPFSDKQSRPSAKAEKCTTNPYKHTAVHRNKPVEKPPMDTRRDPCAQPQKGSTHNSAKKLKPNGPPGKCTLSVTSETVWTNYPGVAQEDPYIEEYKKSGKVIPKLTPEMVERYKAAIVRKLRAEGRIPPAAGYRPPTKRPYRVLEDDDDDEYDSELEDFIADDEDNDDRIDISSHIQQIFGYDKSKYGRESEWELSKMDASYKDIEKEEKRSLRIAREEDAREAKLEEERMQRASKKRKR